MDSESESYGSSCSSSIPSLEDVHDTPKREEIDSVLDEYENLRRQRAELRGLVDNLSRGHLGGVIDRSLADINVDFENDYNMSDAEYSGGEGENDASRAQLVSKKKPLRALNKRGKGQISQEIELVEES